VLVLGALTGCAGDDGTATEESTSSLSADEQEAADNLAFQIIRSGDMSGNDSESPVGEEEAGCIAEGAVTEVGLAELQEYGIVTEDLLVNKGIQGVEMNAEHADALAGVFVDCIDAEALFEKRFLAGLPGEANKDERECVEEAVSVDAVRKVLSASFQGGRAPAYAAMQKAVSSCAAGKGKGQ
jgi:hypothetical protein